MENLNSKSIDIDRHISSLSGVQEQESSDLHNSLHDIASIEYIEDPEKIAFKIAKAFLKQQYPLTAEGEVFKNHIKQLVDSNDLTRLLEIKNDLPTVEHPQLHLYRDFNLHGHSPLEISSISCLQVTKGCTKDCTFCAISADKKLDIMPFPQILKTHAVMPVAINSLQDQIKDVVLKIYPKFKDQLEAWIYTITDDYLIKLDSSHCSIIDWSNFKNIKLPDNIRRMLLELRQEIFSQVADMDCIQNTFPALDLDSKLRHINASGINIDPEDITFTEVCNRYEYHYYDSDPSDYLDNTFLHIDGSPADYADVVESTINAGRVPFITTAGWSPNNKKSCRMLEKLLRLKEQHPTKIHFRLSVSMESRLARSNFTEYTEGIKNIIDSGIVNELLPFAANEEERCSLESILPKDTKFYSISKYSGNNAINNTDDRDVMGCMNGAHMHPNGDMLLQHEASTSGEGRGKRPQKLRYNVVD